MLYKPEYHTISYVKHALFQMTHKPEYRTVFYMSIFYHILNAL